MEYIKIFIIVQVIFIFIQLIKATRLDIFQYCEMIFGSFFIIVFFGLFGTILTLDFLNPNPQLLNNSALIAILYSIWYYLSKKITNLIYTDNNGVIYY
jgi:hypothetical protein